MNQLTYASLKARLAALFYEVLLLIGVSCLACIPASIFSFILREHENARSALVGIIFLLSWYFYFFSAWYKKEQTLAMKTWKIVIKQSNGTRAHPKQLNLRFIWATIFLLLIPLIVYLLSRNQGYPPLISLGLSLIWWILPWGWALIHPKRQFLYDILAQTSLFSHIK